MAHVPNTPDDPHASVPAPDLAAMRRSYETGTLEAADLAPTWRLQLERWLAEATAAGLREPNAMTFATTGPEGHPTARTVLLKGLDDRGLVLFTNLTSVKATQALANPWAALVLPWLELDRQVCVTGAVEQVSRAETEAYARSRPRGSQLGAWVSHQSRVIDGRDGLLARREELAARWPGQVPVPEFWGGLRIVPVTVEFWSGRPDRLHDRLRFRRADGVPAPADAVGWVVERLSP